MTDQLIADLERAEAILLDLTDGSENKAHYYASVCRRAAETLRKRDEQLAFFRWMQRPDSGFMTAVLTAREG